MGEYHITITQGGVSYAGKVNGCFKIRQAVLPPVKARPYAYFEHVQHDEKPRQLNKDARGWPKAKVPTDGVLHCRPQKQHQPSGMNYHCNRYKAPRG
jgi:hypothetical protein